LLTGQTWTGTATNILDYAGIGVQVTTDVASDTKGFKVEYSEDGVSDWKEGEGYTIPANSTKFFAPSTGQGAYYRLKYTNNGADQTLFHVHTVIKKTPFRNTSHNLNDNLNDDDDGDLIVSVLKLRTAQNNYVSASATNNGNFKVSLEEYNGDIKTNGLPVRTSFNTNEIEEASSTVTYIGLENEDGAWYIKKIDTSSGTVFSHATETNNGSYDNYTDAWTNRATLTYGDYSEAF